MTYALIVLSHALQPFLIQKAMTEIHI